MREGVRSHGLICDLRRAVLVQALAVLAAVLPVLASLSFARHETTVQHVRCAEHGELTHVASAAEAPAAARASSARSATNSGAAGPLEVRSAAAHEHCAELSDCLGTEASCAHRTAVRVPLAPPQARDVAPAPHFSRALLLAAAPKTSPPRAG